MFKFVRIGSNKYRRFYLTQLFIALLLVQSLFLGAFSQPAYALAQTTPAQAQPALPDAKALKVDPQPLASKKEPVLDLDVTFNPDPVVVGETVTVVFTLANQAATQAEDVEVTLPFVTGATQQPVKSTDAAADAFVSEKAGWKWNFKKLAPYSTASFSASFTLNKLPKGGAVLLQPVIKAANLAKPTEFKTGTIVQENTQNRSAATEANFTSNAKKDFAPGTALTITSDDGKIEVEVPAKAHKSSLNIQHSSFGEKTANLKAKNEKEKELLPPARADKGLGAFYLEAYDKAGQKVSKFDEPLTVKVRYTREQLDALAINEGSLTLFWFDERYQRDLGNGQTQRGVWVPVSTEVDVKTQTAVAKVDHFTGFQLADGTSPSSAFLPSLQGFQENLYTGSGSYSYDFDIPAGPGGIKPNLGLSYSSAATDGVGGANAYSVVQWTGKGWSLDVGSISLNKTGAGRAYYALSLNGQSYDLLGGTQVGTSPNQWQYSAAAESFLKIRRVANGNSYDGTPGRGGFYGQTPMERNKWQIWTKDGTLYEFSEDLWWGWQDCSNPFAYAEAYKWNLTKVVDTHGNVINYNYNTLSQLVNAGCYTVRLYKNEDSYPTTITWGTNLNDPNSKERFRLDFLTTARTDHNNAQVAPYQIGNPRSTVRLDSLLVYNNESPTASYNPSAWLLARRYNFEYDYSTSSDTWVYVPNTTIAKLTLRYIQRVGADNVTALPKTKFTYRTDRGEHIQYANGGWNRLTEVDNGQGGKLTINYENIGQVINGEKLRNHHRIASKVQSDGRGNNYTWTYAYGTPQLNSLGTALGGSSHGPNLHPNSAALFLNQRYEPDWAATNATELAHPMISEFRGHDWAQVTDPSGNKTKSYFYQGDVGCTPTALGTNIANYNADACFVALRDREFLKGKEYKTERYDSSNQLLQRVEHFFSVEFDQNTGYTDYPYSLSGVWRSFSYERQTKTADYEAGSSNAIGTITDYYYDTAQQGGVQYGNLTRVDEWDLASNFHRQTVRSYTPTNNATTYIVDKVWQEQINGAGGAIALTHNFYDSTTSTSATLTKGELLLSRKYSNVPMTFNLVGLSLVGTDSGAVYDLYGNLKENISYNAAGITAINASSNSYGLPGNGSQQRKVVNTYDSNFNTYPVQITRVAYGQTIFTESADYYYKLGVLTSIVDANGKQTLVQYDPFGRLHRIAKPGDTLTAPTLEAKYHDTEIPFRYEVRQLETAGDINAIRITNKFYDGIGREIQVKKESGEFSQNIVTDKVYNGLGQVIKTSQPRYIGETFTSFWQYTTPSTDQAVMKWTTTDYDAKGRVLTTTASDGAQTRNLYVINPEADGKMTSRYNVIDALQHRTHTRYDAFGRPVAIAEFSGNCDPNIPGFACSGSFTAPWAVYAETFYTYSPLDLLTQVKDAQNNLTNVTYDSLGRKTAISEPNMGNWSYTYDANGNLITQTDARNQTINFGYDGLSRMTSKTLPGNLVYTYNYDEAASTNGKGKMTSAVAPGVAIPSIRYHYTDSGLLAKKVYEGGRTFEWTYDSGGRVKTLKIPSLTQPNNAAATDRETLTYSYDTAWRQTGVCGTICYASGATYNAANQLTQFTSGNGLRENLSYNALNNRVENTTLTDTITNGLLNNRSQTYDVVGNVKTLNYNLTGESQTFTYDHLDRLTGANRVTSTGSTVYNETYSYDVLGNLSSKAGVSYQYKTDGSSRPHAVSRVNGQLYQYDANGSLTQGNGRSITWNAENMPVSVISTGSLFTAESYTYDAEEKRLTRTVGGTTTYIFDGILEEGTSKRVQYQFANRTIAQRDTAVGVYYLHYDFLGSVTKITDQNRNVLTNIDYDPWGKVRVGDTTKTNLNYTGQKRDDSGLMYFKARYYDANIGKFLSADSIIPDASDRSLTVDFHENQILDRMVAENQQTLEKGFWFQMSDKAKGDATPPWGTANPQKLNRYAYVLNNSMKNVDKDGHTVYLSKEEATNFANRLREAASMIRTIRDNLTSDLTPFGGIAALVGIILVGMASKAGLAATIVAAIVAIVAAGDVQALNTLANDLDGVAKMIDQYNTGPSGVAIQGDCNWGMCTLSIISRDSWKGQKYTPRGWFTTYGIWDSIFGNSTNFKKGVACTISGDKPNGPTLISDTSSCMHMTLH